jgi:hypothetical protein
LIVTPGFLDHPKTIRLIRVTGDPAVPLCLLRLWGYCQTRRQWRFPKMTGEDLADVVRWNLEKISALDALTQARFLDPLPGGGFAVHDFNKENASLLASWKNGKAGGRPKKKPNPRETHRLSREYLPDSSDETDRRGEDHLDQKEKIEKIHQTGPPGPDGSVLAAAVSSSLSPIGVVVVAKAELRGWRADTVDMPKLAALADDVLRGELDDDRFADPFLDWFGSNAAKNWKRGGRPVVNPAGMFREYLKVRGMRPN